MGSCPSQNGNPEFMTTGLGSRYEYDPRSDTDFRSLLRFIGVFQSMRENDCSMPKDLTWVVTLRLMTICLESIGDRNLE
jgi:hypothetical protein